MDDKRTLKRKTGDLGEDLACEFLKRRDFEIMERNYLRKWGEIDIVARRDGVMRFVEVKTVTYETLRVDADRAFRPEENMHPGKLKRLSRTIQTYLLHKKLDCDWQLDLVTVKMNMRTRQARVELIENIII